MGHSGFNIPGISILQLTLHILSRLGIFLLYLLPFEGSKSIVKGFCTLRITPTKRHCIDSTCGATFEPTNWDCSNFQTKVPKRFQVQRWTKISSIPLINEFGKSTVRPFVLDVQYNTVPKEIGSFLIEVLGRFKTNSINCHSLFLLQFTLQFPHVVMWTTAELIVNIICPLGTCTMAHNPWWRCQDPVHKVSEMGPFPWRSCFTSRFFISTTWGPLKFGY